ALSDLRGRLLADLTGAYAEEITRLSDPGLLREKVLRRVERFFAENRTEISEILAEAGKDIAKEEAEKEGADLRDSVESAVRRFDPIAGIFPSGGGESAGTNAEGKKDDADLREWLTKAIESTTPEDASRKLNTIIDLIQRLAKVEEKNVFRAVS